MSALLAAIPRWVWIALVVALSATSCKLTYDKDGLTLELEKVRTAAAEDKAAYAANLTLAEQAYSQALTRVRDAEQELIVVATAIEEKKNAEVRTAVARADDLARRLRSSEARARAAAAAAPSEPPADPTPEPFAPGSFGAEFPDAAGDLVVEALRADTVRLSLMQCYERYDRAREALSRF